MKQIHDIRSFYINYVQGNLLFAGIIVLGILLLFAGSYISMYNFDYLKRQHARKKMAERKKYIRFLNRITSIFPLNRLKKNIRESMDFNMYDEDKLSLVADSFVIVIMLISVFLALILKGIGQLWYVKVMIVVMSFVLPYYVFSLALDMVKFAMQKKVPAFIYQFISSFTDRPKIKYALIESSKHIDRKLGRIIYRVGDSSNIEQSLILLKDKFNNVWLNIFVVLLLNHKTVGGDLIDQLYKLNATMSKNMRIEKKKGRRLILYEVFAVGASVLSIPAVIFINSSLLGNDVSGMLTDAKTNMMITRIIIYSIVSLLLIRILRKL